MKIEYRDEFGRLLKPKEAFRQMSYKFHGKVRVEVVVAEVVVVAAVAAVAAVVVVVVVLVVVVVVEM